MKSLAGKLSFAAFVGFWVFVHLGDEWVPYFAAHPGASGWDFALAQLPYLGSLFVGFAVLGALLVALPKLARKIGLDRWFAPPQSAPPPADAGPLYALRTYPVHVGICAGMVVSSVVLYFFWPGAAMLAVGPTIMAWVLLGRRLGFEPANDPAAPHNQMRT